MFSYSTHKWKHLAAGILRRDGYRCQVSKRYGKQVPAEVVHHIYPVDEYPEYAYCPWNLIALSRAEHNALHDRTTGALTEKPDSRGTAGNYLIPPPLSALCHGTVGALVRLFPFCVKFHL